MRTEEGYKFHRCIADPDHFINRYIDYASKRTDAAWDYHEAMALVLLSIATQGILWRLPAMPGGLATNLYVLVHGRTSKAKKSTVMKIAKEIQKKAFPGANIPENFTPGALEEIIADHSGRSAVLWADEFNGHLDRMQHQAYMAGLKSFLLTMYGERNWEYKRVSKGKGRNTEDVVEIVDAHLNVVGNTTPAVADMLTPRDIDDGFLARFAIVWPQSAPLLKGLRDMYCDEGERDALVQWLRELRDMVIQVVDLEGRTPDKYSTLIATEEAYDVLDEHQVALHKRNDRQDEQTQNMTQRLSVMALKLSVLISAGRPNRMLADHFSITEQDALEAVQILEKWEKWATMFVSSLRIDLMQRDIEIIASMLNEYDGKVSRTQVARKIRTSKRKLDELELTLLDRGIIRLREERVGDSIKSTAFWVTPEVFEGGKK